MVALVTLERVRVALRIGHYEEAIGGGYTLTPHDDDNLLTEFYIPAASGAVINYLKSQAETLLDLDSGGDLVSGATVPEVVQVAVIDVVRAFIDGASEEEKRRIEQGYLPPIAAVLLHPLRDPALA
jgi:hypothetical protein